MKLTILATVLSIACAGAWHCNSKDDNLFQLHPADGKSLIRLIAAVDTDQDKAMKEGDDGNSATVMICINKDDDDEEYEEKTVFINCWNKANPFTLYPHTTGLDEEITIKPGGACEDDRTKNLDDAEMTYKNVTLSLDGSDTNRCGVRKKGVTCKFVN